MKKQITLAALLCTLALGAFSAHAMDGQTLLQNPSRYRVVSTQPDGIVYVDMESLRSIQTRDYPSSIENIAATLYVERYNPVIDDMTFEKGQTFTQIDEYTAKLHGQKHEDVYEIASTLTKTYAEDGTVVSTTSKPTTFQNVKHLFISLSRLAGLAHA